MGILNEETRNVQNPALGAALLWRFASGYAQGSGENTPTPLPLLFLVLPIMFHQEIEQLLSSTQEGSGLRKCVSKFTDSRMSKTDLIFSIHTRALEMRELSMNSLSIAISSKLIMIDTDTGMAIPLTLTPPKHGIQQSVLTFLRNAEKLGVWCSQVSLYEASNILKVRF